MTSASVPEQVEEQLWGEPASLSAAEIAAEIGADEDYVRRLWRLWGFPDPEGRVQFYPDDVELFRGQPHAAALFGTEAVEHVTRAIGAGCRNIMEAAITLLPESFGDVSELPPEEANPIVTAAAALLTRLIATLPALLKHHAHETLWFRATGTGIGTVERTMAVAFCDLVGSTQMANESPSATSRAITAFETYAADVIAQRGGRLVKFVGDEVMFATSGRDEAEEIALVLLQWVADHDHLSSARAGVARGPVISGNGDLYGPTVNLAARLVAVAEPDTIVVADEAGSTTATVKGFADPIRISVNRRP